MSTRTAAAVATAKLQQISAVADDSELETSMSSDDAENASSEEESDYESGPTTGKKGEPPSKRAKHSVASPRKQPAAPLKRGKKSLSLLPTMPLDVLFEILGQLAPKDLLNVSSINKLFRETLLASSAKTVWIHALEGAGAPECPSDFTEPRWARLLFRTSCESCGAKNIQKVDFYLRRRVCTACKKKNLVVRSKVAAAFPDCDDLVLSLIPSTNVGGWAHGHGSSSKFFWRSDIEEMIRAMASYKQKKQMRTPGAQNELATFMAQRMVLVDEIQSTGKEFSTWLSDVATGRQNETQQSMKNRQDAIRAKFIELGYEEADLSNLWLQNAYNQKAALSDSIWKRIRPILEPGVKTRKDQRLAIKLRDVKKIRRNLLNQFCTNYRNTISPPLWKYLPGIVEIGRKEPFKGLVDADLDVAITLDNFTSLMSKLPEVITEIQDELKALLIERLTLATEAGQILPSNCLDLATSVFCCQGEACKSSIYVVGSDDIVSHNCGAETRYSSYGYYVDRALDYSRDFVLASHAAATARALVLCAGLDPEKALASEMDVKDLRFACSTCVKAVGYSWRTALSHASAHVSTSLGIVERSNNWRLLSPDETAILKRSETSDPKWTAARWSCSRCLVSQDGEGWSRETVVAHIRAVHKINSPTVPADMFFFEKVVTPFRQMDRILYVSPFRQPDRVLHALANVPHNVPNQTKVNCLMCASSGPSARNRLFLEQGVIAHLKAKHSIASPMRGTHWGASTSS